MYGGVDRGTWRCMEGWIEGDGQREGWMEWWIEGGMYGGLDRGRDVWRGGWSGALLQLPHSHCGHGCLSLGILLSHSMLGSRAARPSLLLLTPPISLVSLLSHRRSPASHPTS